MSKTSPIGFAIGQRAGGPVRAGQPVSVSELVATGGTGRIPLGRNGP